MSTGSAASDAEDYETCYRRTPNPLERSARKTTCYDAGQYSDEELEDEGVDGRIKQERRLSRAQQKEARQTQRNAANARERARMRVLSKAFSRLKTSLPWVPADTKLSKLDTLRLASSYISHLRQLLQDDRFENSFVHPVSLVWRCNFVYFYLAICDDRQIRGPRHLNHCKTLWSHSIGPCSGSTKLEPEDSEDPSSPVLTFDLSFASAAP
ncbi:hypothetical protein INR49_014543 [Caranx melampygus]|nr:hypothetical protein INR49_014543 [Caranx melampygus]